MKRVALSSFAVLLAVSGILLAPVADAVRAPTPTPACPDGLVLVAGGLCTHGGDGLTGTRALRAPAGGVSVPPKAPCAGNGKGGKRLRIYYGYPGDTSNRVSEFRAWIRESVNWADVNLDDSSPGVDGQHLRLYCKNGKSLTVSPLELKPIGGDEAFTFGDYVGSLRDRSSLGLGDDMEVPRFTYAVFVDNITGAYAPGGQATLWGDDRADPALNWNNLLNGGPRFALIRITGSTTTGAYIFLHEVGHTLGAVQDSAPHTSQAGHCFETLDVMCYSDGGQYFVDGGAMQSVCPALPNGQRQFDCAGGDYYEIAPAEGSYLDLFWNTANSGWLTKRPPG